MKARQHGAVAPARQHARRLRQALGRGAVNLKPAERLRSLAMAHALVLRVVDAVERRARAPAVPVLRELLALEPGARLLDLGGGTGLMVELLDLAPEEGVEAVVVEPDTSKVAYGRRARDGQGVRFEEAPGEALPFPDAHFSRAMAILSLHHVEDLPRVLAEVHRVLAPGGRLVVQEFHPERHGMGLMRLVGKLVHHGHVDLLAPADLLHHLAKAGFDAGEMREAPKGYLMVARKA